MTNEQVVKAFVNQNEQGGSSDHIWFEGQRIYSYNWQVATIVANDVALIASWAPSLTTSKHLSRIKFWLATAGYVILEVLCPWAYQTHDANLRDYEDRLDRALERWDNTPKAHKRDREMDYLRLFHKYELYIDLFCKENENE